ncbi:hypothetical protein ACN268_21865 [Micromonospora sp. WMMD735]|uniref:hypothetical protein n=1 Tax=Micromonospora sp. WMMD735 TaxID=3404130 RepID=UPI003B95BE6A
MKRSILTPAIIAALIVAVTATPATATTGVPVGVETRMAATSQAHGKDITLTGPPAPRGAHISATPTISPSVKTTTVPAGGTYSCPSGTFCAAVWNGAAWKIFLLYSCHIYDLYNWTGTGYWVNNQSPGAPSPYLLDSQGIPSSVLARSPSYDTADWDPVYSISNCY